MGGNAFRASAEWLADRLAKQAAQRAAGKPPEPAKSAPLARATPPAGSDLAETESETLRAVLAAVRVHPAVAFAWRANAGAFRVGAPGAERFVRAGFAGQSDILGMLRGGQFLAIEVKRPDGGGLTQAQHAFLSRVNREGGCAFVARGINDVMRMLDAQTSNGN